MEALSICKQIYSLNTVLCNSLRARITAVVWNNLIHQILQLIKAQIRKYLPYFDFWKYFNNATSFFPPYLSPKHALSQWSVARFYWGFEQSADDGCAIQILLTIRIFSFITTYRITSSQLSFGIRKKVLCKYGRGKNSKILLWPIVKILISETPSVWNSWFSVKIQCWKCLKHCKT